MSDKIPYRDTWKPCPMRAYAETGLVAVETVRALLAFGEPMLSESYGDGCRLESREIP